jgi:hypothetical protein
MQVPVVSVRVVGMGVAKRLVLMQVRMLAQCELAISMGMLMVLVMLVLVVMQHRFMGVDVRMLFSQMQEHPCCHQHAGNQ